MPIYKHIMPEATVPAGEATPQVPFDPETTVQLRIPSGKRVYYVYDDEDPEMLIGIRFGEPDEEPSN